MAALVDRAERLVGIRWLAGLALMCAAIGLLAGLNPTWGVAAALGIAFAAIVLGNTSAGLILFTFVSFLEVLRSGGPGGSFMKIAGLLLFGSWLARTATEHRRSVATLMQTSPMLLIGGIALVAWSAISIAWAESTGNAVTDTYRYLLDLLLIPIMFGTLRRRQQVMWLAAAFVLGAAISALYGFLVPTSPTGFDAGRLTGTVGDANDQAAVLVGAIALALALVGAMRGRPVLRALAVLAVLVSLAGVVNTLSRSGLLALGAMMVAGVILGGQWRRWAALLLVVSSVGVVGYFVAIAPLSARQRVTSADTSGRSTIWTIGWRMAQAHPLNGVGSGNFPVASIHYLQAPGSVSRADLIVDTPKVAHNIYLEMLADMGLPGLLALLAVLGGSMLATMRAASAFRRTGQQDLELVSRCVALGLIGFMVSDFFLSGQFSKQLWLLIALGPTLLSIARAQENQAMADDSSLSDTPQPAPMLAGAPA